MRKWIGLLALLGACGGGEGPPPMDAGAVDAVMDAGEPDPGELLESARPGCVDPSSLTSDAACFVVWGGERFDGAEVGIAPVCPLPGENPADWDWGCRRSAPVCYERGCENELCEIPVTECELQAEP